MIKALNRLHSHKKNNCKNIKAGTALRAALALCVCAILSGCGSGSDNLKTAYECLGNLDYAGAMNALAGAEEAGEDAREIARARGIACIGQADYSGAADYLKQSLDSGTGYPDRMDVDTNYYLAAAYNYMGDYAAAEDRYNAIIGFCDDTESYLLRASVRLKQSNFEGAVSDFNVVISRKPNDYDTVIEIYEMLTAIGYRDAGMEYIKAAISGDTGKMTDSEKGRMYYYMGDYTQAAAFLESARNAEGSVTSSLFLGRTYEAMGEYNYAANVYESYIGTKGASAELYDQLGLCRLKLGEYEAALEAFKAGKEADDGTFAKSLDYNLAVAYEYISDFDKAYDLLQEYAARYPDDADAARELLFLQSRISGVEESVEE